MVGNSKPHRTTAPSVGQLLCSLRSLEQSPQTEIGRLPGYYIGSVGSKFIWCYPAVGSGPVYWAQSGHPFSCSPLYKWKSWEFPYTRKEQAERDQVTYKLEAGKMMSGLLRKSFIIMVLSLGQKMSLGLLHPGLYAQLHYLALGSS
jgi:hypothetical protein